MKRKKRDYTRKRILLFLVLFCIFGQNGCSAEAEETQGRLEVITTIFPAYDFVRQVGGEHVQAKLLLPPGMESHSYEPTPRDMISIMNSDLFLYVGGESDVWVDELLDGLDNEAAAYRLMEWVDTVAEENVEGMQERESRAHEGHHHEEEYDEHIWTSPQNAMILTEKIAELLCGADPDNEADYRKNAEEYLAKLKDLDDDFEDAVKEGGRDTIVFGDRFPFRYFADRYGLTYYAAFPGCSSETEPSAAMVAFLTDEVKREEIPAVFYLEMSNHKIADVIAESTGAKTLEFHSCHNVTKKEREDGETYISLMRKNLENLKEALN